VEGEAGARAEGAACGRVRKIRLKEMRCVWAALHEEIRLGKKTKEKKKKEKWYYGYFVLLDYQAKLFCQTVRKNCFSSSSEYTPQLKPHLNLFGWSRRSIKQALNVPRLTHVHSADSCDVVNKLTS